VKNAVLTLILIMIAGCGKTQLSSDERTLNTGPSPSKPVPQFELQNIAGGSLKSEDLQGKVTVLDFWATWCEPCLAEIANYNRLKQKYEGRDVQIVGVTVQSGSAKEITAKVKELRVKYSVVLGDDNLELAFGGVIGYPTTFLIAKDGTIFKKYLGAPPSKEQDLDKQIEALLAQ
jgi:peroxiredoxin